MNKKHLLLFDYGGVLGYDHLKGPEQKLAQIMGVSVDEMNSRLSEKSFYGRAFRENKMSEYDFWAKVGENALKHYQPNKLTQMWMDTYSLNQEFYDFCISLRQKSWVGVLTNIDVARSNLLKVILNVENSFDFYFPSYEFGFSKDAPELWNKVDKILKKQLSDIRIIYIDDRKEHVNSAQRINWEGVLYKNLPELKIELKSIINF